MAGNYAAKIFAGIVVLALVAIAIVALRQAALRAGTSSIAITLPSGGERWQAGETHIVTWNRVNIPAGDMVALNIRRIPPPPLPEEGQEFDPVIAINLPNTGKAMWTISSMYPSGSYVLGISAYQAIPVTDPISAESAPFTIAHPALVSDLYPLYAGVDWNASEVEQFMIGTSSYSGASIASAPLPAGNDPGSVITPFERYYDARLKARGWSVANDLAAGGHVGGQTGYRKGGEIILIRFGIQYSIIPSDAPSECPCSVVLSLFSENGGQ